MRTFAIIASLRRTYRWAFKAWQARNGDPLPEDEARKLAAKRSNHRVVLFANSINAIALTTLGVAFITPRIDDSLKAPYLWWILFAVALHLVAQASYGFLRSED